MLALAVLALGGKNDPGHGEVVDYRLGRTSTLHLRPRGGDVSAGRGIRLTLGRERNVSFRPVASRRGEAGGDQAADTCRGLALVVADLGAEQLQAFPDKGCQCGPPLCRHHRTVSIGKDGQAIGW